MAIPTGTKFGLYEVLEQIGEGGMGVVYQAHDSKLGRDGSVCAAVSGILGREMAGVKRRG